MTEEERDIEVEKLRLELLESYKARVLWSYTVRVWIDKIPSYKEEEPIKEEIVLTKSFVDSYSSLLIPIAMILFFAVRDISSFQKNYIVFISVFGSLLLVIYLFSFYYQKDVPEQIIINKKAITIGDRTIEWADIFQIYTASYAVHTYRDRVFLSIALSDYSFKEFEISNWAYRKIGNTLEHYRLTYIDKD